MSRITIGGCGAVSSAGWGVEALMALTQGGEEIEWSVLERETTDGRTIRTRVARVPAPADKGVIPKAPRLRRASSIAKYAAAAAVEALGEERLAAVREGSLRVGVISTLMNGCVNYSNRFYGEVLENPSTASPIVFPETVYNAPSSHLSALMGSTAMNDTLVGDGAEFFTGMELATEWLLRGDCEMCLVVASEEVDWLSAEAMGLYAKGMVPSEGSGALLMERDGEGPVLLSLPDPVSYAETADRTEGLERVREALGGGDDGRTLLADSRVGVARFDRAEDRVFGDWSGPRISLRERLGESLGASTSLQVVLAVESVRSGLVDDALVTAVGGNEQVAGCRIGRA